MGGEGRSCSQTQHIYISSPGGQEGDEAVRAVTGQLLLMADGDLREMKRCLGHRSGSVYSSHVPLTERTTIPRDTASRADF